MRQTKASANAAKEWLEEQLEERNDALERRGAEVEQLNKHVEGLQTGVEWLEKNVEELSKDLTWVQACNKDLAQTIGSRDGALAWRAEQVDALEKAKIELLKSLQTQAEQLQATSAELGVRNQELAEIHMSRGWRIVMKLRAVRDGLQGIFRK